MKKLNYTEWGHPILARKMKFLSKAQIKSKRIQSLIEDMMFTIREGGVGLAANQVGKDMHMAVMTIPANHNGGVKIPDTAIINSKILEYSKKKVKGWEACMSCPGVRGLATRSEWVKVSYLDGNANKHIEKFTDFPAIAFQHEIDHLNGIRYAERIEDMKNLVTNGEYGRRHLPAIIAKMKREHEKNGKKLSWKKK